MSKLKELKAAYGAATADRWELWPDFDEEGFTGHTLVGPRECAVAVTCAEGTEVTAKFIALAHNLMPQLLEAAAMLREARSLIDEAVNVHIYDTDNGDEPDADCPYMAFLGRAKTLLEELK